jgi:hypothetical protein
MGAALDLVSKRNDPLLAWTLQTWPYLTNHRIAATRFIWKSFLAGEIWMGGTSPDYILPDTWKWFRQDIAQSKPVVFTVVDASLAPGNPFTATSIRTSPRCSTRPIRSRIATTSRAKC